MIFGQVVIGPPGSGKTTYCNGMSQFLGALGRDVAVVNLDPANDLLPYKCDIDISELITVSDVMDRLKLGPNGGLIYCIEFLEKNVNWLHEKLKKLKNKYILFDCPGQIELYTHHNSFKNILALLQKWNYNLVSVHLVDSHYCSDAGKFVSVLLTSLSTMLQMELPHVNILSKADLIEKFGKLSFNLDFYTEVLDLSRLLDCLRDDPIFKKYKKLNAALIDIVQDYSLVSFLALNVQDKGSMWRVVQTVDKAVGYMLGNDDDRNIQAMLSYAGGAEFEYEKIKDIREKYMDLDDAVELVDPDG